MNTATITGSRKFFALVVFLWFSLARSYDSFFRRTKMQSKMMQQSSEGDDEPVATTGTKHILMIRHGRSLGNDMMDQPGNRWGDPTFRDDGSLIDSPLSDVGVQQAKKMKIDDGLKDMELVVVSPLTRTLQTFEYGVLPKLPSNIPIIAQSLATERVYTASDTGTVIADLKHRFPSVDFSLIDDNEKWWYHTDVSPQKEEWRPHQEGQWYAVPGEPKQIFEERMDNFQKWLAARPETRIVLVCHWAIFRYLTGDEFENCEARLVQWEYNHVK